MKKKKVIILFSILILIGISVAGGITVGLNSLRLPTNQYICFGLNKYLLHLINGKPDEAGYYENATTFDKYNKTIGNHTIIAEFNYMKPLNRLNMVTYEIDVSDEDEIYQNILDFYQKNNKNVAETKVGNDRYISINDSYKVKFHPDYYNGEKSVGIVIYKANYSYWGELLE